MFQVALFLLICSVAMVVVSRTMMTTAFPHDKVTNKLVGWMMLLSTLVFMIALGMVIKFSRELSTPESSLVIKNPPTVAAPIMKSTEVPTQVASNVNPSPTATAVVATPTEVVEEEKSKFGGVMIENPSGQWFSIRMWNEDKKMYVPYIMTNNLGEEVTKNKDSEYFLEAEDAETYFEGYVLVGTEEKEENKHDFVFDFEKDGTSIKKLNI